MNQPDTQSSHWWDVTPWATDAGRPIARFELAVMLSASLIIIPVLAVVGSFESLGDWHSWLFIAGLAVCSRLYERDNGPAADIWVTDCLYVTAAFELPAPAVAAIFLVDALARAMRRQSNAHALLTLAVDMLYCASVLGSVMAVRTLIEPWPEALLAAAVIGPLAGHLGASVAVGLAEHRGARLRGYFHELWDPLVVPSVILAMPLSLLGCLAYERAPAALAPLTMVLFAITHLTYQRQYGDHAARELNKANAMLTTDPLTSLWHREYFFERATQELTDARRRESPVALAMVDLDHFKRLNDTVGHQAGDAALVASAAAIAAVAEELGALCGRYGGEEFAVLLPGCDELAAQLACEQIRVAIADAGKRYSITASFGVAAVGAGAALGAAAEQRRTGRKRSSTSDEATSRMLAEHFMLSSDTLTTLITRADDALYRAKRAGRNQVRLWSEIPSDAGDDVLRAA